MTVDHVLADIPHLVRKVKLDLNSPKSRVVSTSHYFGGGIAVLARKRYPHIVDAVWSSGGIFNIGLHKSDYYEDFARQLHRHGGTNCTIALARANQRIIEIVEAKDTETFEKLFGRNEFYPIDLSDPQHVHFFYAAIFDTAPIHVLYQWFVFKLALHQRLFNTYSYID